MKIHQMKSLKQHAQAGFTLIELVVVIVILGILAATALPRFFDLTTDARKASVAGVAGGFTSGVAIEHAKWLVDGSSPGTLTTGGACNAATCDRGTSATIEGQVVGYNSFGYTTDTAIPNLTNGVATMTDQLCVNVWTAVLSSGRPTLTTTTAATATGGFEWGAEAVGGATCKFTYFGGARVPTLRLFIYNPADGSIALTNA